MDELSLLARRIEHMAACAAAHDWARLKRLDEDVAAQLRTLADGGAVSSSQAAATVAALSRKHLAVLQACREARDAAALQLQTFCAQREARQAYDLIQQMESPR